MPRPLLKTSEQTSSQQENRLNASGKSVHKEQNIQMDKLKLDRLLRQPRSKEYMEAMRSLDAGGHTHNQQAVDRIIDAVCNEFPEWKLRVYFLEWCPPAI